MLAVAKRCLRVLLLIAAAVSLAEPALAAEVGGGRTHFLGLPMWVWLTANLVVFWGLIFKFAGAPVSAYLTARAERIAEAARVAGQQRQDAAELKSSLEAKIEELRGEVDALIEHSRHAAEQEKQEILEQAEEEKARLLAQTRDEINSRVAVAKEDLRREAAALATKLATEQLTSTLGAADRDRLFDEALARLEKESFT